MPPRHYAAWITTDSTCLDQPNVDVVVLEDVLISEPDDDEGSWSSTGTQWFHGITGVNAKDGDHGDACREALALLENAGWRTQSLADGEGVDTGYTVTVEWTGPTATWSVLPGPAPPATARPRCTRWRASRAATPSAWRCTPSTTTPPAAAGTGDASPRGCASP